MGKGRKTTKPVDPSPAFQEALFKSMGDVREIREYQTAGVFNLVQIHNEGDLKAQTLHSDGGVSFILAGAEGRYLDFLAEDLGYPVRVRTFIPPWSGVVFSLVHGGAPSFPGRAHPSWHGYLGFAPDEREFDQRLLQDLQAVKYIPKIQWFEGEIVPGSEGDISRLDELLEKRQADKAEVKRLQVSLSAPAQER